MQHPEEHPEEGTIHAWLDGELSAEDGRALELHAGECTECAAKVAEARGLIAASSRIVSALDSIPGDVIPEPLSLPARSAAAKEAKRHAKPRMWYSSGQFRATAAVIFVAGASLILARGWDEASMQRVMSTPSSSAPAEVLEERALEITPPAATAPGATAPQTKAAKLSARVPLAVTRERDLRAPSSEAALRKEASAAPAPAPAPAPVPSAKIMSSKDESAVERRTATVGNSAPSARISGPSEQLSSPQINQVVVTGVAEAADPVALRSTRADTVMGSIRTTYAVSSGVEVILVESPLRNFSARTASPAPPSARVPVATGNAAGSATADAVAAPVSPPARVTNSISWLQKATGRMATLSGPLSKEELEAIRQKLPAASR